MQGIEFEEEKELRAIPSNPSLTEEKKLSIISRGFEKFGISDQTTINLILLAVAAIFFGITLFLYANLLGGDAPKKKTAEEIAAQLKVMKAMQSPRQNE